LDEADLLGDTVAVLAAPGKLVAQGTPVKLKSELGKGYVVSVSFRDDITVADVERHASSVLDHIQSVAPACQKVHVEERVVEFQLNNKDPKVVQTALGRVEEARKEDGVKEVDVRGASLEGVFLDLMAKEESATRSDPSQLSDEEKDSLEPTEPVLESRSSTSTIPGAAPAPIKLDLTSGRPQSFLRQTLVIFHKRTLIARRAWLTPFLAVLVAIAGACIPLVFLNNRQPSCVRRFRPSFPTPVYLPLSPEWNSVAPFVGNTTGAKVLERPAGIVESLGATMANVSTENLQDGGAFDDVVNGRYRNLSLGGVSFDFASGQQDKATFAWEASSPGGTGLVMLNLVNNILFNRALNASSGGNAAAGGQATLILAHYEPFPLQAAGTLVALKWVAFFGAAMVSSSTSSL
jgi:ATP-binding cassette, subfamily A (ABC1), member 3